MSLTTPYGMIEIGNDGLPLIDSSIFDRIMTAYGFNVRLRRNPMTRNCPCYDPYGLSANPVCTVCGGTGSVSGWQDRIIRGLLLFKAPKGDWSLGERQTIAGHIERVQVMGFFSGSADIRMDDRIGISTSSPTQVEDPVYFRVDNLMPRIVGDGHGNYIVLFIRADMRKVEYESPSEGYT